MRSRYRDKSSPPFENDTRRRSRPADPNYDLNDSAQGHRYPSSGGSEAHSRYASRSRVRDTPSPIRYSSDVGYAAREPSRPPTGRNYSSARSIVEEYSREVVVEDEISSWKGRNAVQTDFEDSEWEAPVKSSRKIQSRPVSRADHQAPSRGSSRRPPSAASTAPSESSRRFPASSSTRGRRSPYMTPSEPSSRVTSPKPLGSAPSSDGGTSRTPTRLSAASSMASLPPKKDAEPEEKKATLAVMATELPKTLQSALSKVMPSYFTGAASTSSAPSASTNGREDGKENRVAVANVNELKNGEMKEVPFPHKTSKTTILLSKVDGEIYAISAKCSHKGGPLVKGDLSPDGRITCPWHGACFDVTSGDIEDGPANGPINSYKVEIVEGNVFVTASTEEVKARRRKSAPVPATPKAPKEPGVVIVGGGVGAMNCITALREEGYRGSIIVLSKEKHLPYDRTALSKSIFSEAAAEELLLRQEGFYKSAKVDIRLNSEVIGVDAKAQCVHLANSKVRYAQLLLAVGLVPRRLSVPGKELGGIFTLRSMEDAQLLSKALNRETLSSKDRKIVVIGASFVGMELSIALCKSGTVTVVGQASTPFESTLGKRIGDVLQGAHEKLGISFRMSSTVKAYHASKRGKPQVGSVELVDGSILHADIVIEAIGARPATRFLRQSGFDLTSDGGVEVDSKFRLRGRADNNIFAIGDIAVCRDRKTGRLIRTEHWANAANQGRAAGAVMAEKKARAFNKACIWWSAQTQQLRYVGTAEASLWESVVIRGDLSKLKFTAYYGLGNDVVAVASMQSDPIVAHCADLFRRNIMPTMEQIRNRANPLEIGLAEV